MAQQSCTSERQEAGPAYKWLTLSPRTVESLDDDGMPTADTALRETGVPRMCPVPEIERRPRKRRRLRDIVACACFGPVSRAVGPMLRHNTFSQVTRRKARTQGHARAPRCHVWSRRLGGEPGGQITHGYDLGWFVHCRETVEASGETADHATGVFAMEIVEAKRAGQQLPGWHSLKGRFPDSGLPPLPETTSGWPPFRPGAPGPIPLRAKN